MIRFVVGVIALLSALNLGTARADDSPNQMKEVFQGHIEIYGRAGFLLRLTEKQLFSISIHNHSSEECGADDEEIVVGLKDILKSSGRKLEEGYGPTPFTLHVEYIGGLDPHNHCMVGFDVSLLRNYNDGTDADKVIAERFDYMNSVHLMKVKGLIHEKPERFAEVFVPEVLKASTKILYNLIDVQKKFSHGHP